MFVRQAGGITGIWHCRVKDTREKMRRRELTKGVNLNCIKASKGVQCNGIHDRMEGTAMLARVTVLMLADQQA